MSEMLYQDKVAWLWRYRQALRRQAELEQEVEQLDSAAKRVTPMLSGMPGGPGDGNALPRAVETLLEAKAELEAQCDICGDIRREVVAAIEQVTNRRDNEILRRRYILGQRWEEIAVEMHYKYQHICRCHRKAVEKLVIECDTEKAYTDTMEW